MNPNSDKKPNRLIREKSPYLLQHAYNPVDWFPWSEDAFEKAKNENKPILLSIGYSTCHWCHVMERESFENVSIAEFLNSNFVSIKLDREERPDIDKIYMDALHAMDQQGGWPLNMFLTPEKLPIAGGTYFPPEPRYGRKSFLDVLRLIKNAWDNRRDEVIATGENLVNFLNQIQMSEGDSLLPDKNCWKNGLLVYKNYFDPIDFGFKTNQQNKFPPSMGLMFLMSYSYYEKDLSALDMVEKTLKAMKKGGIYDQVGGGISRYSTDHKWRVPHFEKMLYDNSLFLSALVQCYSITKNEIYKNYSYSIIEYIHRDMQLPEGGICSAEDADSDGEEGKFYTWEYNEFKNLMGEDAELAIEFWNLTPIGNFEGKNILYESLSENPKFSGESWNKKLKNIKEILLNYRSKRNRPLRDDKVLTSWNCLYIKALAEAGRVFQDNELISIAENIYSFLENNLLKDDGRLLRRWRAGEASISAFLSDHAELAMCSIELFQSTFNFNYLGKANKIAIDIMNRFQASSGIYYDTAEDSEKLIRRSIDTIDSVEPSGNSTFSLVLQKLASYGFNPNDYLNKTENIFKYLKKDIEQRPLSSSFLLKSFMEYSHEKKEIVLTVKEDTEDTLKIKKYFQSAYHPDVEFIYISKNNYKFSENIPIMEGKKPNEESAILYICKFGVCERPVVGINEILMNLRHLYPEIGG